MPWIHRPWLLQLIGSLKFQLAAGSVAALALGIGATTAVLVSRVERDTLADRVQLELTDSVRTARLLDMRVLAQQQALAVVAAQMNPQTLADPAALRRFLENRPVLRYQFDSIFVTDANGQMLALYDRKGYSRPAVNLADRAYFARAMVEARPVISEPITSRVSAEPLIVLAHPLRANGQANGQAFGLLAGGLRLKSRDLLADVADVTEGDEGVLVVVSDARGQILAHPEPALIGASLSAEPRLAAALARWVQAGRPVELAGLRLGDAQRLVVVAGAAGPEWVVWRSRLRAEVLAPLAAGRTEALKWAAAIVAGLGLCLLLLLHFMLRPLARLEARALHLFDGSQALQTGWPNARGEIGRLENVLRHLGAERTQLETSNRQVIQQLESVMASAPVGIIFTRDKKLELVSEHGCVLLGRSRSELLGQPAQNIYASNEDYLAIGPKVGAAFACKQPFASEVALLRGDGSRFWARLRGSPVAWGDTHAGTIWTISDITDEITARMALEWAVNHDPLTGLANRKAFEQRLKHLFDALPRSRPAVLLMFDLDRFKPINDHHGHAAGDAMLRAVAAATTAHLRPSDLVVRLGGDEFAVLLERCPADVALRVAEELRRAICNIRLPWDGHLLELGASIGVAALSESMHEPEAWVAAADRACYEAKAAGRNTVRSANVVPLHLVAPSVVA